MAYKPDHSKLFGEAIKYLLAEKKLSQRQFAQKGGLDCGYVSKLINGLIVQPRQEKFTQIAKGLGLTVADLRQIVEQYIKEYEEAILKGEKLIDLNKDHPKVNNFLLDSVGPNTDIPSQETKITIFPKIDWGEAPETEGFVGREEELNNLQKLIRDDHCRLIAILACGGTGKSALARELVEQNQAGFDFVIWRSLRDAPPLEKILLDCLQHICPEQSMRGNETIADKINFLFQHLQKSRCLIILDNFETLFVPQDRTGKYREGYKNYGDFIKRIGETSHQSCLLITSREKPSEVVILEGKAVRSQQIKGLQSKFAIEMLEQRGLEGTLSEKQQLVECYDNNPLALKIIAGLIIEVFNSKISPFLEKHISTICHSDIDDVLEEQYDRLTRTERELIYWLAINREFTTFDDLASYIFPSVLGNDLTEAICNLKRRSLVEMSGASYTLQNVIMEYVTERLCQVVSEEIISNCLDKFNRYAFLIARAKDYVRETQRRLIIQRIIELTEEKIGSREFLINHLNNLINVIRAENLHGYAGGNLLDILIYLQVNLTGYDFSGLTIRQAFLRDVELHDVNLENAELHNCIFAEAMSEIRCIVFSDDGEILSVGDALGNIHIWQTSTREKLNTLSGHEKRIRDIHFSSDKKTLISVAIDKKVLFWDIATGNLRKTIDLKLMNDYFYAANINHDQTILATSCINGTVDLWNINSNKHLITLLGHKKCVNVIIFSGNDQVITVGEDSYMMIWNKNDGKLLGCVKGVYTRVRKNNVVIKHDQKILVTVGKDFTVKFWNIQDPQNIKCIKTIMKVHDNEVHSIAFSPDGKIMATGGGDQLVKLWDISDINHPYLIKILKGHSSWVSTLVFSPDQKTLISSSDKQMLWWDIQTINQPIYIDSCHGRRNDTWRVIFSKDGQTLISANDDGKIRMWDITTGKFFNSWQSHDKRVTEIILTPDGKNLASCSWDYLVKLWNFNTGKKLATFTGHIDQTYSITCTPDQKFLISVGDDRIVKFWNMKTEECTKNWQPQIDQLFAVAISPNGQMIATGGNKSIIKLWNINTNDLDENVKVFEHDLSVLGLAFSPDNKTLASTSYDRTVRLWDIETGNQLKLWEGQQIWKYNVEFSPNGQFLAFGSRNNTVCLWDSKNDECYYLSSHENAILTVAFSPDSQTLASSGTDQTIKIWDVNTRKCLKTLKIPLPYEGTKINGIKGLAKVEQQTLQALGAVR